MAKKLNSMPDFTAHLPKSVHDMSQSTTFTCTPGMLSPIYHDMLHTGDQIHFSASQFVRLNPLVTQPLGQIDIHLDYFFVPLSVLYTPAPSMFYQTDDLLSGMFTGGFQNPMGFPVFNFRIWFTHCFVKDASGENWQLQNAPCVFQSPQKSDEIAQFLPSQYFDSFGRSVYRMFDFLDMAPEVILDALVGNKLSIDNYPLYTPWFALAYQAIYQLYFRNDDRERKNYHYNIDIQYGGYAQEDPRTHKSIFQINYCQRPKDYFNSVKVSPITSSISSLSSSVLASVFSKVNEWISDTQVFPALFDGGETFDNLSQSTQAVPSGGNITSASIRNLFMVEKLLRVIGRSEKNYESQFLAHFGVKIPHDPMHNITHIGHDMVTLTPDSVISSANTWNSEDKTGSALGEIGGKGSVMLSGRKHSFQAPFHGVFMCISHIVPRRRYVLGLSKLNQLSNVTDFWQPEFDKKGMQPLFLYEALYNSFNHDTSVRVGWQFAYEQFKRKSDRVITAFVPTPERTLVNQLAPWVIANRPYHGLDSTGTSGFGTVSEFAYFYMVQPTELNVCMQVPYNPSWSDSIQGDSVVHHKPWLLYQRDPFICDFNMYCKKVNGMSEYGEPEL